ncbi:MAG: paraquat-inducible protein A [gamma proteobacterium symbiont of Lucinoma myriamae]|nr:paraquat-inducible protein A [gamma proteobacterium symbiont of Lucinoma myriamae]
MTDSQVVNITQFSKSYPVARIIVNTATLLTLVLFFVSLISPLFTLEKFYFFANTVSLFSALWSLIGKGHLFLFLIIFVFSILFPILKLSVILYLWNSHAGATVQRLLKLIHQFGKWSMLDVFVVALMVVSIKLDAVAEMQIHYGLYLFLTSVILSIIISAISTRFLKNHIKFNS